MTSQAPTSIDANKATVREVVDKVWNGADKAAIDRLYDPSFVFYVEGGGHHERAREHQAVGRRDPRRVP